MFDDCDYDIKHKPLHGTCLYEVLRLLPEYGGTLPKRSSGQVGRRTVFGAPSSSKNHLTHTEEDESSDQIVQESNNKVGFKSSSTSAPTNHDMKPLTGKKILVVEDMPSLRVVARQALLQLGATVELCENGKEALYRVRSDLLSQRKHVYDYILMDCEVNICIYIYIY